MASDLSSPIFYDETKARDWLEATRWPDGPVCPHCGGTEQIVKVVSKKRVGLYRCGDCAMQFTVTVGTLYERSHIPLHKWLLATHLLSASKMGISTHQLHRMLDVTYKSAWFMTQRIREGMREFNPGPLGGAGKIVELDEAFIGGLEKNKHRSKRAHKGRGGVTKKAVFALIERDGAVRSHHIPTVNSKTLRPIMVAQIRRDTTLMSDGDTTTQSIGREYVAHHVVNHSIGEYVRRVGSDGKAHTNSVENYFSILKRGITGTYFHVSPQHLKRYLAEFDFRYNERAARGVNDAERMTKAVRGIEGKRLTYRRCDKRPNVAAVDDAGQVPGDA